MPAIPTITVTEDSAELPISLSEVKVWLNLSDTDNDAKLTMILNSVVGQLEAYIRRPIIDKTILFKRSNYQYDCETGQQYIDLPYPIYSLESVTIYDKEDADTVVVSDSFDNRVILGDYSIDTRENHAFAVSFVSGIARDALTCPYLIKQVLLEMCRILFYGSCENDDMDKVMANASKYVNYIRIEL